MLSGKRGFHALDWERCTGCGECEKICPTGAIRMENGRPAIDYSLCVFCGFCVEVCTPKALMMTDLHGYWTFDGKTRWIPTSEHIGGE